MTLTCEHANTFTASHNRTPFDSHLALSFRLCPAVRRSRKHARMQTRTRRNTHFESNKSPGMFHTSFCDLSATRLPLPFLTKCFFEVSPSSCRGHLYLNVIDSGGRVKESVPVRRCWLLSCVNLRSGHA